MSTRSQAPGPSRRTGPARGTRSRVTSTRSDPTRSTALSATARRQAQLLALPDAWLSLFITHLIARDRAAGTIGAYGGAVRRLLRRAPPWDWTVALFEAELAAMRQAGLAQSTREIFRTAIFRFCEFLTDPHREFVAECRRLRLPALQQVAARTGWAAHREESIREGLDYEVLQALFTDGDRRCLALRETDPRRYWAALRNQVAFKVLYVYGVRPGELCDLNVSDFGMRPLHPEFGMYASLEVRRGKGGKRRTVFLPDPMSWIVPVLDQYMADVRPVHATPAQDALFVNERGDRLRLRALEADFAALRKELHVRPDVVPHTFRHCTTTHLQEYGINPVVVQKQLGHTFGETTDRYTHFAKDWLEAAMSKASGRAFEPIPRGGTP